jgi:TonB family protein
MRNPNHSSSVLVTLVCLSFLLFGLATQVRAQQPRPSATTARGIQLYEQGEADKAIKILSAVVERYPEDADAWYYLGLAFNSQGMIGVARAKFERVIALRPNSADSHAKLAYALILANEPQQALASAQRAIEWGDQSAEAHYAIAEATLRTVKDPLRADQFVKAVDEAATARRINPNFAQALITESFAHFQLKQYSEAATSLEEFLRISPDDPDAATWREQLEALRERAAQPLTTPPAVENTILNGKEVTQRARVLSKPEPQYTEAARQAGVQGTIVLRAVFASDGEVKHVLVSQALGYGLTTQAVQAARKIKFQPATKDGKAVSMYVQLEYNFNLY